MRFVSGSLGVLLLSCACKSDVKADFENICNAEQRSGAAAEAEPAAKAVVIARWLHSQLKTEQAQKFLQALAPADPAQKGKLLSDEALKYGVSPCPIADETWPRDR